MTAHKLAEFLLKCKDYPVLINGWGSDEGRDFEVSSVMKNDRQPGIYLLSYDENKPVHMHDLPKNTQAKNTKWRPWDE